MTDHPFLRLLGEVLGRLAAAASTQLSYLTDLGVTPSLDELALEFDAAYRPVRPTLVGVRSSALLMQRCDAVEEALSSNGLGWDFADADSPAWGLVRERAQAAVAAFRSMETERTSDLARAALDLGDSTMNANALQFLIEWFARQCDGDWEHDSGIRIETLDNPGWAIHIRIEDTELEGRVVDWVRSEDGEVHWLHWRSTGLSFDAACGPRDLERALAAFESFAAQGSS